MVSPVLVIGSRLGSTDCSGCRIFRRGRSIFAKRLRQPEDIGVGRFVALPVKVAELPTICAAEAALKRINEAKKTRKGVVNLEDLETSTDCPAP